MQRLFRELARGDSSAIREAQRAADDYLRDVWRLAGASYFTAELTDARGVRVWYAGSDATSPDVGDRQPVINEPVRDLESNRVVGSLALVPRPAALWTRDLFAPSFGRSGYGVVIDRASNRVLLHPNSAMVRKSARDCRLTGGKDSRASPWFGHVCLPSTIRAHRVVCEPDSPLWTVLSSRRSTSSPTRPARSAPTSLPESHWRGGSALRGLHRSRDSVAGGSAPRRRWDAGTYPQNCRAQDVMKWGRSATRSPT